MATTRKSLTDETVSLIPSNEKTPRPRLHKLIVRNFRSIGAHSVEVELDDIVVLVGPNNAGKSSILRAYEVVMKQGSNEGKLQIEDFPNGIVDPSSFPEIELQTIIYDNAPGERWLSPTGAGEWLIREQWRWTSPNTNPQRRGFDVQKNDWDDQVPWGAPNVANSRRPLPHRIEAFSSPDAQAKEIIDLLVSVLKDKLKAYRSGGDDQERPDYELLIEKIADFQLKVVASARQETEKIETEISNLLERVFPNHRIKLDAKPESDVEKSYTPFRASPDLLMGPADGYLSKVSQQGSGARRTLLWTALRYLSEAAAPSGASARPHVLLLDEPEICLHPTAIREAREVLYSLPNSRNWQVMITTHSPIFIDLAKDNTTVVRVERQSDNQVHATTLYRPTKAKLDEDDRANLKALNACDPYVNEFFFGGDVVVVEGDTEYTAFSLLKAYAPDKYRNLHIIRARGKGSILTILKILNQFSSKYAVLHDSDTPFGKRGASPAWGVNASIRAAIDGSAAVNQVRHVVSVTNFEVALFGKEAPTEKPFNTMSKLTSTETLRIRAESLLDSLLDPTEVVPAPFVRWTDISTLQAQVEAAIASPLP